MRPLQQQPILVQSMAHGPILAGGLFSDSFGDMFQIQAL